MVETENFAERLIARYRPRPGWAPFLLLIAALGCAVAAVLEVNWVPEDAIVLPAAFLGFFMAALLAQRPVRPAAAWLLLALAGLALTVTTLAEAWPPAELLGRGSPVFMSFWRQQLALFFDRIGGWLVSVLGVGRSTETLAFAWGLGLAAWFLAAFLAWSCLRMGRPYLGLSAVGLALAINTYYGEPALYWLIFYTGLGIAAAAVMRYVNLEADWERQGYDYPAEVRLELLVYAGGVSLLLMALALAVPSINVRAVADAFRRQPAVQQAEGAVSGALAGVRQPRSGSGGSGEGGGGGPAGALPRAFLLGGGPELEETVMMTALVSARIGEETPARADAEALLAGRHWRAVSYDVYTGRGWAVSAEREEPFAAGRPIPIPPDELSAGQVMTVTQQIEWIDTYRAARYALGRPVIFDQATAAFWRGRSDLVRVLAAPGASSRRYEVASSVPIAPPDALRLADPAGAPPELLARYTELPETTPQRVRDLAREIVDPGDGPPLTAYDQARAIETFLRQYPYSLEVGLPPPDVDVVDYFLFDLQTGFCDYYASAMVVLARSLGLPARLAIGFLPRPPDENGVQAIRQADAHSWAEVYFPGYGWIEFEPTAPFPSPHDAPAAAALPQPAAQAAPTATPPPVEVAPIPERAPQRRLPGWAVVASAAAAVVIVWIGGRLLLAWLRENRLPPDVAGDEVRAAFARLQGQAAALGYPPRPGQTPHEFAAGLLAALEAQVPAGGHLPEEVRPGVARLTELFVRRQYRGRAEGTEPEARGLWRGLRRALWRLRLSRRAGGIKAAN